MNTMETPIMVQSPPTALLSRNMLPTPPTDTAFKSEKAFTPADPSNLKYPKPFSSQPEKRTPPPPPPPPPVRVGPQQEIGKVIDFQSKSEFTQENICRLILSSRVVKRRKINFIKVVDTSNRPRNDSIKPKAVVYEWSPYLSIENLNDVTVSDKYIKHVNLKSFSAAFLTCLVADVTQVLLDL